MKMGLVLLSWVWLHHFGRRGKNEYQQLLESQVQPEQSLLQQIRTFFLCASSEFASGHTGAAAAQLSPQGCSAHRH